MTGDGTKEDELRGSVQWPPHGMHGSIGKCTRRVLHAACLPSVVMLVNSEGFPAEVFHPWVRWEGPGSGFENSSGGGAGGGGVWAQVGGPKLGPRGWAQAGPKWVGPLGIEVEKQGFQTVRKITGQKFP